MRIVDSKFRKKRFENFIKKLNINFTDSIIDLGGLEYTWIGTGLEQNVTIMNLSLPEHTKDNFKYLEGDACNLLMLCKKSFDVGFSNSVIEHVGEYEKQFQMANELRRVCRRYWIQTPYKHFPIEIHLLFPFF